MRSTTSKTHIYFFSTILSSVSVCIEAGQQTSSFQTLYTQHNNPSEAASKPAKSPHPQPTSQPEKGSDEHTPSQEKAEDPLASVRNMQLPSDIIDLLLAECSDGLFNKTKLGSSYGQSRKYLITLFFLFSSLLAGTMLLFAKGCAVCYKKALNGNKELFVRASFPAFVLYLFFVSPVVYKLYTLWKYLQFPGYFFLTNTGILLIEQGSMDQFSWFSYKDLEYGSNTFVLINGEVKRVLRIIDKLGQIHDYASELFDPTKYPRISPILHANITKIPQGGSD